ncbi:Hypothetical protein GLP15_179 [Giardia lamblia P15]|uniref:Uncharacterized protein n=1 Tax=Giardia intestinalis (strain P15) TaxID=658858 RepID=E1F3I4_GIAIA|nr:Hypothetical protein GLP15_179 [Giardia lamblia P15]
MSCSTFGMEQTDGNSSLMSSSLLGDPQLTSSHPNHMQRTQEALELVESEKQTGPFHSLSETCGEVSDVFLGISSYCFARMERLQQELTNTQRCLNATDSQLEDTQRELSTALHNLEHQKQMREHQQRVMDRIVESKLALEAKLDELESLLNEDIGMYIRFRQQTMRCILVFEEEVHSLKSELFEAKQDNIFCRWKNLTLSDEVIHLTAMNSLLKQKLVALENQAVDHNIQHNMLEAHKKKEMRAYQSTINALEKQCFYFKSKYTEVERQHAKAKLDLTVMKSIIKGKDAEIKKLTEKLQSATVTKTNWVQAVDKKKVYTATSDALVQLQMSKELLTKTLKK